MKAGISQLVAVVRRDFAEEADRLFLWSPAMLMIGIGLYFAPDAEPPPLAGLYALAGCGLFLAWAWSKPLRWMAWVPFLVALGFGCAQLRAYRVWTPLLSEALPYHALEGTIEEIEPVEKRVKLVLSQPVIEELAPGDTPKRVRVSYRNGGPELHIGDRIRMQASLYPLPPPIMPGSYDFSRHFYFRGIGGNGYAMHPPQVVTAARADDAMDWLGNVRHRIGDDMRARMPDAGGTVAAAMTVGETGPIPEEVKVVLRASGLAHMLSISGLHLGMVAGIVFFNVRLLLTLYPPLALRVPVKKIAALLALVSALVYLLLAGCTVPAQRAFIMVTVLFLAMLLDRRGITLRTLAIAAFCILLLFPEAMLGASFQMSFAATLAIVSLYEQFGRQLRSGKAGWIHKGYEHALGTVCTSLVATAATAPFVLYSFNRFALFGVIANTLVIPLAGFVLMPGIVLALILFPLGLQGIAYVPLRWGMDVMIDMAAWVTALPYSTPHLPAPTDAGLVLSTLALLWFTLLRSKWRWMGLPMLAGGLATMMLHQPIDLMVSRDLRQVMARMPDGRYTLLKGTMRSFTAQNWLRAEGEDVAVPLKESGMDCDGSLCRYARNGHSALVLKKPQDEEAREAACGEKVDVLIAWRYLHHEECPGPVMLVGRAELERYGAQSFAFEKDGIRMERTRESALRRVWQPPFEESQEEDDGD